MREREEIIRKPWVGDDVRDFIGAYPSERIIDFFDGIIGAIANPAYKKIAGDEVSYRDMMAGLLGQEKRDWVDVVKARYPDMKPKMQTAYGTFLNMLLDPTNIVPGAAMAGEIKNVRHVSPHKFDKFSGEFVGTGEGSAAFGVGKGGYWTESDEVVDHYVKSMGKDLAPSTGWTIDGKIIRDTDPYYGKYEPTLNQFANGKSKENIIKDWEKYRSYLPADQQSRIDDYIHFAENFNGDVKFWSKKEGPYVYEGTIAKDRPHTMLQWDKPVTKAQWNKIRSQAIKEGIDDIDAIMGKVFDKPGSYVYYNLSDAITRKLNAKAGGDVFRDDPKLASEFLKRAGIDGIEYPSGTLSGVKDSPHKNYVVFDDADITINKRTSR